MSEKISLNIALFKDNVTSLRNSVTSIDGQMSTSETLEKTNITPFIDDLENTIRALELLIEYKALFQADLEVLEDVGEKIREKDTQLSQVQRHDIRDGYQPLRT